jgi:Uma2 family endonuclease
MDYIDGEIWVDASTEDVFAHTQVKTEFTAVLQVFVKSHKGGRFFADGLRVTHIDANLSVEPDGCFVSQDGWQDRVRAILGAGGGYVELEGSPDMVQEIVSDSSVGKDTKRLKKQYWEAEIPEYGLVDVRGERLGFDIFRRTASGHVAARKKDGRIESAAFGTSFRLTRRVDALGHPEYSLEAR